MWILLIDLFKFNICNFCIQIKSLSRLGDLNYQNKMSTMTILLTSPLLLGVEVNMAISLTSMTILRPT